MQLVAVIARSSSAAVLAITLGTATTPAAAQRQSTAVALATPGQSGKYVSVTRAVAVTREVLVGHGYQVIRVERLREMEVILFRRPNTGRGQGLGPIERLIVKPSGTVVVFEAAPPRVLVDVNVKLGL